MRDDRSYFEKRISTLLAEIEELQKYVKPEGKFSDVHKYLGDAIEALQEAQMSYGMTLLNDLCERCQKRAPSEVGSYGNKYCSECYKILTSEDI